MVWFFFGGGGEFSLCLTSMDSYVGNLRLFRQLRAYLLVVMDPVSERPWGFSAVPGDE